LRLGFSRKHLPLLLKERSFLGCSVFLSQYRGQYGSSHHQCENVRFGRAKRREVFNSCEMG
jgi:hypothetical protein